MFAECFLGTLGVVCALALAGAVIGFAVILIATFAVWAENRDDGSEIENVVEEREL